MWTWTVLLASFGYVGLLFAIAYYGDRRARQRRSLVANPYIYALSMAVYCTAWTFYGSVGRASVSGVGFLPIYLGPTLTAALGWLVFRKIIRICKIHRITTIADFIASRYGKSSKLGGFVTIIAVLGVVPYISLQLKAISTSFLLITHYPEVTVDVDFAQISFVEDTTFYVTWLMAMFAVLFGSRHLETTERHEGLVTAIAFESLVKLCAFLSVGVFVTYGIFNGLGDLFSQAIEVPRIRDLMVLEESAGTFAGWTMFMLLSMGAVIFLPRQFQITVVENVDENHLKKAMWLFPLYMLVINIFVLPIAFGGMLSLGEGVDPDIYVLSLPMQYGQPLLALFVFIGGLSAATGMVIVETVALSTMLCNDLVMPILLRMPWMRVNEQTDITGLLLSIRHGSIILVLLLGYTYFHLVGEFYTLVSIGLTSFTAVAQFAPAIIGGLFWKGGTRRGALSGMLAGFVIWGYTLVIPSLAETGFFSPQFITDGLWGVAWLKPFALFGLQIGLGAQDPIAHAVFWSLLINCGVYVVVSLFTRQSAIEHTQAVLFVDVFRFSQRVGDNPFWRGSASVPDLRALLTQFLGEERAEDALFAYAQQRNINWKKSVRADPDLVEFAEKLLAGAIGSASARVMVSSVVKEEPLGIEEVMDILDETRQVIAYSHELEKITAELKAANERLQELDSLKDEFISTVTHELRTPLTSIRSIAEIIHDTTALTPEKRVEFAAIIMAESKRLTRLINQVLDFQKLESGSMQWQVDQVNLKAVVSQATAATEQLVQDRKITVSTHTPEQLPAVSGDHDRLVQVMVNLLSNAVKFCSLDQGRIEIDLQVLDDQGMIQVAVTDNGEGIAIEDQDMIFEKFQQVQRNSIGRPVGSGLGLSITKQIVEFHGGRVWVESGPDRGTTFFFTLPVAS